MISPTTAETILVVDDYEAVCSIIEILLCRAGYCVLTATNGADALQIARNTSKIDLLIANLGMPEMDGEELAGQFAQIHPSASVVYTSGFNDPVEASGSIELLPKPFTVAELRRTVHRALQMRPAFVETSKAA